MGANRLSQFLWGIVRQAAVITVWNINSFARLSHKVLETPLEMWKIWWTDSPTPLRCMFPRARQLSVNPISLQVVWNSSAALHGSFFTDCRYSAYWWHSVCVHTAMESPLKFYQFSVLKVNKALTLGVSWNVAAVVELYSQPFNSLFHFSLFLLLCHVSVELRTGATWYPDISVYCSACKYSVQSYCEHLASF